MPVSSRTGLTGILACPVGHSLSPVMQNAAFSASGLDYVYLPLEVVPERLPEAVAGLRALGFRGANVTIPHKEAVCGLVDRLSTEAGLIGAVNTLVLEEEAPSGGVSLGASAAAPGPGSPGSGGKGYIVGHNTDAAGFLQALRLDAGLEARGIRALILGAGGACRAVSVALARAGAEEVYITSRTAGRSRAICDLLREKLTCRAQVADWGEVGAGRFSLEGLDLLVNTTPLGMHPHEDDELPLPASALRPGLLVADLVYNPLETRLLRAARERGCRVLSGVGMLVYQGAEAFRLWTGREAPAEAMRRAVLHQLRS